MKTPCEKRCLLKNLTFNSCYFHMMYYSVNYPDPQSLVVSVAALNYSQCCLWYRRKELQGSAGSSRGPRAPFPSTHSQVYVCSLRFSGFFLFSLVIGFLRYYFSSSPPNFLPYLLTCFRPAEKPHGLLFSNRVRNIWGGHLFWSSCVFKKPTNLSSSLVYSFFQQQPFFLVYSSCLRHATLVVVSSAWSV